MYPELTLDTITARTKGEIKRLRRAGFVPVSIQHKGVTTRHFQQNAASLNEFILQHGRGLLTVVTPPDSLRQRVIVHDVQRDPMSRNLLQVTFQQIDGGDTLKTSVRLVFQGEPAAVFLKEGILQHPLDRLDIECQPGELPDHITANVASLLVGEVFRVSNLAESTHYKILTPQDTVLASVTGTRTGNVPEETVTEEVEISQ